MDEGGLFAAQELASVSSAVEVVALGKPSNRVRPSGTISFPRASATPNGEVPGRGTQPLTSPPAGLQLIFERIVNSQTHPVLLSHVLDARAVVPMALHMEWLAHAALHGQSRSGLPRLQRFADHPRDHGRSRDDNDDQKRLRARP